MRVPAMARLKLLLLVMVALFMGSNGEGREETQCPEYCQCQHTLGQGMNVFCNAITPVQSFQDTVTSFHLVRKTNEVSQLIELPQKFFIELGSGLKHVDSITITVEISMVDRDAFQGLDSLTNLNLIDNGISYIHPETFANHTHLRLLSLSKNPLKFDGYFLNIPDLRELDLSSCQLKELTPNAFDKLAELVYLNLESNSIVNINPNTFQALTVLEELNLSNNLIEKLNPDSFKHNEALNVLKLNDNPLVSIESLELPSITNLYLQNCGFTKLTSTSFARFPQILKLNLSGNSIVDVDPKSFSKLNRLLYLDLSNNRLAPLDSRVFSENQELEMLSLRDNPTIMVWPEEGFQGQFENMYSLDISNIGIDYLTLGSLKNMSNVAHLDLSRNELKGFEVGVLPPKVKFLSLALNVITSMDDIHFPNECQVRHLFLQGNKIKYLTRTNFDNLPYLSRLDLSSCQVETIWMDGLTEQLQIKTLRQLSLLDNKLQKILPHELNVFSNLNMLDIRHNPLVCDDDLDALLSYLRDTAIEPIASSYVGYIDEHFERFLWDDIRSENCDIPPTSSQKPNGKVIEKVPIQKKTESPHISKTESPHISNIITITDNHITLSDGNTDYEDVINIDNDNDYDQYKYERPKVHYRRLKPTSDIIKITETSPVMVVFLSTLAMTLIVTLLLALLSALCKRKITNVHEVRKRHGRSETSIYKPLHKNEQQNIPTTPIVKKSGLGNGGNDKNGSFTCVIEKDTYISTDYRHTHVTPQTI